MKAIHRLETILFACVLMGPTLLWLLMGGSGQNLEKRELAAFPSFDPANPAAFVSGFETWYTDHTPFKNEAVRLQNTIDYQAFRTTGNKKVQIGQDGWLFYSSVSDGDPIADYKGMLAYSDEDLAAYADVLRRADENLAAQGIELYMLVAPNKEIAYCQHMPKQIVRTDTKTRTTRLVDYLGTQGIDTLTYLDGINAAAAQDDSLYYHLDTHWNLRGAYAGYQTFCELAGSKPAPAELEQVPHEGGDLATMLNMTMDEPAYIENRLCQYETLDAYNHDDIEVFQSTWEGADPRNVVILSDSFRESFNGFVAAGFAHTASMTRGSFSKETMDALPFEPDIVLVLAPERYINKPREVLGKLAEASFE